MDLFFLMVPSKVEDLFKNMDFRTAFAKNDTHFIILNIFNNYYEVKLFLFFFHLKVDLQLRNKSICLMKTEKYIIWEILIELLDEITLQ
jgi:hypothetical protein